MNAAVCLDFAEFEGAVVAVLVKVEKASSGDSALSAAELAVLGGIEVQEVVASAGEVVAAYDVVAAAWVVAVDSGRHTDLGAGTEVVAAELELSSEPRLPPDSSSFGQAVERHHEQY